MIQTPCHPILPAFAGGYRADQIKPPFLTIQQQINLHVAFIHQLHLWHPSPAHQFILDLGSHFPIGNRSQGGFHLGNQAGIFRLAGFGEMHFITMPFCATLHTAASFQIIRGTNPFPGWWLAPFRFSSPINLVIRSIVLLNPNAAEAIDLGGGFQCRWAILRIDRFQQINPSSPMTTASSSRFVLLVGKW